MTVIVLFFLGHWFASLFFHSFFLHRYVSHRMYTTSRGGERIIYILTWLAQGSSFLVPRAYGVMHRMHHHYSDTEKDPHSPHFFTDIWRMMSHTMLVFKNLKTGRSAPESIFLQEYLPVWPRLDRLGDHLITRLLFGAGYIAVYVCFAPSAWWFLLIPVHFVMGPLQGAIVNWCGHKYGYRNFNTDDHSRNSTPFGVLLMGELFQNNHHNDKANANFARRWFEFDLTYIVMLGLHRLRVIRLLQMS